MDAVRQLRELADELEQERGIVQRLFAACEQMDSLSLGILFPIRPEHVTPDEWQRFNAALESIRDALAQARGA